jgi:hypothetical protein
MQWTVSTQHKDFFQENHTILFEEVVKNDLLITLKEDIRQVIQKLGNDANQFIGKDFCDKNLQLEKFVKNKQWAKIFAELCLIKDLRFGFSRLFFPKKISAFETTNESIQPKWSKGTLKEFSSIQGLLGGVLFCLNPSNIPQMPPFGSALFFDQHYEIPFDLLSKEDSAMFLLIAYCDKNSVYIQNTNDWDSNFFRQFGYIFGDRLKDKFNPLLYQASKYN